MLEGIKFIPLRTTGGELIPESGLFVRINKEEAEDVQPSSLRMRSANLRRQEELNDEIDPKTLSTIRENEEDYTHTEGLPNDVDVMQSINPIAFNQRRPKSPSNPRPVSSPPLMESFSVEDKDAQKEERSLNEVVVVVDVNDTKSEDRAAEETDFQAQDSSHSQTQVFNSVTSSSKPRTLTIEANPESTGVHINEEVIVVEAGGADMVKEYRLRVKAGEDI
jgi:hypothetical protein